MSSRIDVVEQFNQGRDYLISGSGAGMEVPGHSRKMEMIVDITTYIEDARELRVSNCKDTRQLNRGANHFISSGIEGGGGGEQKRVEWISEM